MCKFSVFYPGYTGIYTFAVTDIPLVALNSGLLPLKISVLIQAFASFVSNFSRSFASTNMYAIE
jgi:hypothetical protein